MSSLRIGIDLGGSKIEGILMNPRGEVLKGERVVTPAGDYAGTLAAIAALIGRLEQGCSARVGIGTPGAPSPANGLLRNANSTCLNGRPLQRDLETLLGRRIRIANDANCFALSEAVDGAGAGAEVVFGVILGTGTGGGLVVGGQLLNGPNAITGEWGHNPLPWPSADELPGADCYCGRCGCIETWLSGPGFSAAHCAASGQTMSAEAIAHAAAEGDSACLASLDQYLERLAKSLAAVINLLDPEVIVLGGGLSKIEAIYQQVPQRWSAYVFSDVVRTQLVAPRHGDASGVRGAAWLWQGAPP